MSRITQSCEIDVPVSVAYAQWTHFDEFPLFMRGVEEVRPLDDRHLHWRAEVGGKSVEWDAEVVERVPDRLIAWRSTSGASNEGSVRFESAGPSRCRVSIDVLVSPATTLQKIGDAMGLTSSRIRGDLERFKQFVEGRRAPTGEPYVDSADEERPPPSAPLL